MLKFKVGDRVVRVPCMDDYQDDLGRVGTVTKVLLQCGEGYVDVEWDVSKPTDREYNTIGMWQNKFELLKDKEMTKFKVGDRVYMHELGSKYSHEYGTVKGFIYKNTNDEKLVVHFDGNEPDHAVNFPTSYFLLINEENTIQQQRNNEVVKYAEWFKYAIRNINSAGGDPMIFIDKLPPDVIDSMVRNNLFIIYRGKDV